MQKLTIATHDGTFHTDDVFACATLSLVFKDRDVHIVRTRDDQVIARADIAVDVGSVYSPSAGRFDHHQQGGAGERANKIPYASFGLVWKEYGHMITGSVENAQFIDEELVQGIDAHDNGFGERKSKEVFRQYVVGDIISSWRPTWQENTTFDDAFIESVTLAKMILMRIISHTKSYVDAQKIILDAYEKASDKKIIEIGREYPGWDETLQKFPEPLYVLYERTDGKWGVKAVREKPEGFDLRKPLPQAWAGLRDQELAILTGVADAVFCHNSRFIAVARSREGAIKLAALAVAA